MNSQTNRGKVVGKIFVMIITFMVLMISGTVIAQFNNMPTTSSGTTTPTTNPSALSGVIDTDAITPGIQPPTFDKPIEEYSRLQEFLNDEGIRMFEHIDGDKKNEYWVSETNPLARGALIQEMLDKIYSEKLKGELAANAVKIFGRSWSEAILEQLGKEGVDTIGPLSLTEIANNPEGLNKVLDLLGIDVDPTNLATKIEKFKGFGNQNLKWAKEGNIIGDGSVWLDMDKIPTGINEVEYKDGRFILTFKSGGKIVLEAGSTDETGKIVSLAGLKENGLINYIDPGIKKPGLGLNDLMIIAGEGEVKITSEGFEITGQGTKVRYGDFLFERKDKEKSEVSYVRFANDRLIILGTEFTRQGYARVLSTENEFIVQFGELVQKVQNKDDPDKFDTILPLSTEEAMAREISFDDKILESSIAGSPFYASATTQLIDRKINLRFDKDGNLIHILREDLNGGGWVGVDFDRDKYPALAKSFDAIYEKSSKDVQKLLDRTMKGEKLTYRDVKEAFYSSNLLKREAGEIKIEEYQANFLSMNGENFAIGGKGSVEVLRDLNSITGYDTKDFKIKVGESRLDFDEKGLMVPRTNTNYGFEIDEITWINNGKITDDPYAIQKRSNGNLVLDKSDTIVAGREVINIPGGVSVDLSMIVDKEKIPSLIDASNNEKWYNLYDNFDDKGRFMEELKKTDYEFKIDANVPLEGVVLDKERSMEILREKLLNIFYENLFPQIQTKIAKGTKEELGIELQLKDSTRKLAEGIVLKSLDKAGSFRGGKVSISLKNDPSGSAKLFITYPGASKTEVSLTGIEGTFVEESLESIVRAPYAELGGIRDLHAYDIFDARKQGEKMSGREIKVIPYWPRPYTKRLWYYNMGMGSDKMNRIMDQSDATSFLYNGDDPDIKKGYIIKYFEEVPKK